MDSKKQSQQPAKPQLESAKQAHGRVEAALGEKRRDIRKPYFMAVDYATDDRFYQEFIFNISGGGVYIETRQPLPVGQPISLTFTLPDQHTYIKTSGNVVRTDGKGIGVAFRNKDLDIRNRIIEAVANL
ncbi:MAG: PilZ domain-containing protein [Thermodesulfobacteriota bacterium]